MNDLANRKGEMMWLRVIAIGFGVAVAAQSLPANAGSCESESKWKDGGKYQQKIRISAKKESGDWRITKRVLTFDGKIIDEDDSETIILGTNTAQIWQKSLRYSGKNEINLDISQLGGARVKFECTFPVNANSYMGDERYEYQAKAGKVKCADLDYVVACDRSYKSGSDRFDFEITLGVPPQSAEAGPGAGAGRTPAR